MTRGCLVPQVEADLHRPLLRNIQCVPQVSNRGLDGVLGTWLREGHGLVALLDEVRSQLAPLRRDALRQPAVARTDLLDSLGGWRQLSFHVAIQAKIGADQ